MGLRAAAEKPLSQRDKEKAGPVVLALLLLAWVSINYYRHLYSGLSAKLIFTFITDVVAITDVQNQTACS